MSFNIFKINILTNNEKIKKILVFYGSNNDSLSTDKLNKIFKKNPNNPIFFNKETNKHNIFNYNEIEEIIKNNIDVIFLNENIYIDDTILTIKIKIVKALSDTICIDDIYLFCLKMEQLININIYRQLTQNNKIPQISKKTLEQFLSNIIKLLFMNLLSLRIHYCD